MPRIKVNDVDLEYELIGEGPTVVWTPGGWIPRDIGVYLFAGRLSRMNRVLVWDRRNCGASDILIEDSPNEMIPWVEDLRAMLHELDLAPAVLGGVSFGSSMSLMMAHRYPEDVKALVLVAPPADNIEALRPLVDGHYHDYAKIAEKEGMKAVAEATGGYWSWPDLVNRNPENLEKMLAMNPHTFAGIMRQWAKWVMSGRVHLGGLSDDELQSIDVPILIAHGHDGPGGVHPRSAAEDLRRALPNVEWVNYSSRYSQSEIERFAAARKTENFGALLAFVDEFVSRVNDSVSAI